jgi:hypothetical protein
MVERGYCWVSFLNPTYVTTATKSECYSVGWVEERNPTEARTIRNIALPAFGVFHVFRGKSGIQF